jgi:general secretion pathway protein M
MRSQLAEMETLGQEARGLSAITATPVPHGNDLQDALNASLTAHGLKATRMAFSGESVQVQLDKVPFGAVAEWLQEVKQAQRMKVIDSGIMYVGATALVNVTATLQGPAAGAGSRGGRRRWPSNPSPRCDCAGARLPRASARTWAGASSWASRPYWRWQ